MNVGNVGALEPLALPPVCAMNAGERKHGASAAEPSRAWIRAALGSSRRRKPQTYSCPTCAMVARTGRIMAGSQQGKKERPSQKGMRILFRRYHSTCTLTDIVWMHNKSVLSPGRFAEARIRAALSEAIVRVRSVV